MASTKKPKEKPVVVHLAEFYLKSGQYFALRIHKLETGITDNGQLASYSIESHPDENISYMYIDPSEVAAIVTRLEPNNESSDNVLQLVVDNDKPE